MPEKPFDVVSLLGPRKIWAPYKLVPAGNGKHKKLPVDPRTTPDELRNLEWRDRKEFWTYSEALDAAQCLKLEGVGLFTDGVDGNLCALDLDNCIAKRRLLPAAQTLIKKRGTYTEFSPGGHGLHQLFTYDDRNCHKGEILSRACQWANGVEGRIELYFRSRHFLTFTNRPVGENLERPNSKPFSRPVAGIGRQLLVELLATFFPKSKPEPEPRHPTVRAAGQLSDSEALAIHRKDRDFQNYWVGNPGRLNDPSRSGIRWALQCKLAFTVAKTLTRRGGFRIIPVLRQPERRRPEGLGATVPEGISRSREVQPQPLRRRSALSS